MADDLLAEKKHFWTTARLVIAEVITVVVLLVLFVVLGLRSNTGDQFATISDVTKPARIVFKTRDGERSDRMHVEIRGRIDGAGVIKVSEREPQRVSGDVEYVTGGDYYAKEVVVEYEPEGEVKAGKLEVKAGIW